MKLLFILASILMTTGAMANEAPPVPEGGFQVLAETTCSDNETGQKGMCYYLQAVDGRVYLAFWQQEVLMFIREIKGDSYETIWVNDEFNTI